MVNLPKCQELFTLESDFLQNIFDNIFYPWELIPKLKVIIDAMLTTGIPGYTRLTDKILVADGAYISDRAYIEGTAIIGKNATLRHGAYLRGSVILCEECVVGNSSEIKNSILMTGAQAPHFNYVGDSILGNKAHLGAGAICSNLRSDRKSVTIKSDSVSIDTGLKKLGAILGDDVEVGCGAVLCPGSIIGKNSVVYPLTMVRGVHEKNSLIK